MKSSALLLLLAGMAGTLWAQAPPTLPGTSTGNLPAQKIHANDLVGVSVYGEPDLTRTVRVGDDGTIRLPLLKDKIKADGLMPEQLEQAIVAALKTEELLVDPFVTVTVAEYHSLPISVAGAVKTPVTFFPLEKKTTLLEAITRAGGLAPEAGTEILITGPASVSGSAPLVRRILVKSLIDATDPESNLLLEGGEEIRVPEAGKIYVVGNVKKPGQFPLLDASGTSSVLKALALSEGLEPYATYEAYIYRREGGTTSPNEIQVDLRKIMDRKSPDVILLANDVLYIPDAHKRRATMNGLKAGLGIAAVAVSALVYALIIH
jgi:polysaccharide export outer membrane protein